MGCSAWPFPLARLRARFLILAHLGVVYVPGPARVPGRLAPPGSPHRRLVCALPRSIPGRAHLGAIGSSGQRGCRALSFASGRQSRDLCQHGAAQVAIKKVLQDKRFKNRELQIMKLMRHPNVVDLQHCFYTTEKNEVPITLPSPSPLPAAPASAHPCLSVCQVHIMALGL